MPINFRSFNELFSHAVFSEFERLGVRNVFIAPGSRSTPLVLAADQFKGLSTHVHFDERGLGFYALGCARATETPTVIITTSGTAVANLFPAIIEAYHSHIPLIVCTADRPFELRNSGANQAIDQNKIFGNYVRFYSDIPCPSAQFPLESLLTTIDQGFSKSVNILPGPVHFNFMFQEPLVPPDSTDFNFKYSAKIKSWWDSNKPYTHQPLTVLSSEIPPEISEAQNGLLLLGSHISPKDIDYVEKLCNRVKWPILADVQSQIRFKNLKNIISHADLILASKNEFSPDLILHVGGTFTSKNINSFLDKFSKTYIQFLSYPEKLDPLHKSGQVVISSVKFLADSIQTKDSQDLFKWIQLENKTNSFINQFFETPEFLSEPFVSYALSKYLNDSQLYLGSSRPIRDMDRFASTNSSPITVFSNRGTSGIDGNLASLAGTSLSSKKRTYALIGDLAVLHDLNSFALLEKAKSPITLILINNNGGGIFSFLPVARETEAFEKYFATPHGLDFEKILSGFDVNYFNPENPKSFFEALEMADQSPLCSVIEIKTDRNDNFEFHQRFLKELNHYYAN